MNEFETTWRGVYPVEWAAAFTSCISRLGVSVDVVSGVVSEAAYFADTVCAALHDALDEKETIVAHAEKMGASLPFGSRQTLPREGDLSTWARFNGFPRG